MDSQTKKENLNRMYYEGVEVASRMIAYLKNKCNDDVFNNLDRSEKKQLIKKEHPEFITFIQLYPIVAEYLINEGIFSNKSFKKYIKVVYGMDKSQEDKEFIAKDPKNIYYYKNKQYALYYKFLLQESNKHLGLNEINKMYYIMVNELNSDIEKMFNKYEKATKEFDKKNEILIGEKKKEFIDFLKNRFH